MTTYSTEPNFTKKLTELLKKLEAHRAEARELETTIEKVNAEENQLLETADLNDPKSFKQVSDVRLKKELLPKKIARLNDLQEEVLARISAECDDLTLTMRKDLHELLNDGVGLISRGLLQFFPGDQKAWKDSSIQVFENTRWGRFYTEYITRFGTESWRYNKPESKAKRCQEAAEAISGMVVLYLEVASKIGSAK